MQAGDGERILAVAHRAGNDLAALREALDAGVDLVEADVRWFRRALEVRHTKTLGPRLLWDRTPGRTPRRAGGNRWELVRRRDVVVPDLAQLLAALGGDPRVMLDLKGLRRGLAPAVAAQLRALASGVPVTVCTRHWWMFDAFAGDPHVRQVLSAGSRRELGRLRTRLRTRPHVSGTPRVTGTPRVIGVSVFRGLLTPAVVAELHTAVEYVMTWPVDSPAELADARRLGVSGVISKNLPLLRDLLTQR